VFLRVASWSMWTWARLPMHWSIAVEPGVLRTEINRLSPSKNQ